MKLDFPELLKELHLCSGLREAAVCVHTDSTAGKRSFCYDAFHSEEREEGGAPPGGLEL